MHKSCTRKKIKSIAIILLMISCLSLPLTAHAEADTDSSTSDSILRENPETGYQILLEDNAQLLDADEREQLADDMEGITAYGNAVFITTSYNLYSASSYAETFYHDTFGKSSGTLFLIDMDNREIYIFSDGAVYKTITKSYAQTITDNVYSYASKGNYYRCASEAFEQIYTLLAGQRIAQPMKYISNILLALILAALINYFLAMRTAGSSKASSKEILSSISTQFAFTNQQKWLVRQDKVYSPPSSSGGGHSGGGHSGGGHSGGGGGHRF